MNGVSVVSARIAVLHTRLLLVHYAWRIVTDLGYLFTTVVLRSNCGRRFSDFSLVTVRIWFFSLSFVITNRMSLQNNTMEIATESDRELQPQMFFWQPHIANSEHQSRQTKQWWRRWGNGPECGFISDRKVTTVPAVMSVKWSFHAGENIHNTLTNVVCNMGLKFTKAISYCVQNRGQWNSCVDAEEALMAVE